jgi:hypothetical protein
MGSDLAVKVSPLSSMRCWAIELNVEGRVSEIPALPAADWWPVLAEQDLSRVLDLIESDELDDAMLSGEVSGETLSEALTAAVEEVAGRSLHVAFVLAAVAEMQWPIVGGQLSRRGFRWDEMPLGAALDAIYLTVSEGLEEKARERFEALLANESLTSGKKSEKAQQEAMEDFSALAGPRPSGGVRSTGAPSDNARPRTRRQPRPLHPGDRSGGPMTPPGQPAGSDPSASS